MKQEFNMDIFNAIQEGEPYASYRKTTLGKVYVTILNVFSGDPEFVQLHGQPGTPDSIVNVWSIPEDIFFKRHNRRLFESGDIIKIEVQKKNPEVPASALPEQASDEELKTLVNSRYKALEAVLNKTNSEALVFRILGIAKQEDKSARIINAIELRLAEIQNVRYNKDVQE